MYYVYFFRCRVFGAVIREYGPFDSSRLAERWFVHLNTPRVTENEPFQMMSCADRPLRVSSGSTLTKVIVTNTSRHFSQDLDFLGHFIKPFCIIQRRNHGWDKR